MVLFFALLTTQFLKTRSLISSAAAFRIMVVSSTSLHASSQPFRSRETIIAASATRSLPSTMG